MKNAKVYVPSVSTKVLATENKGQKVFIAVEIGGNNRYTHLMFDEDGYKVDENGKKIGKGHKVAFKVTEKTQAILTELFGKEFENALVSGFNHNELIKIGLECMDFVPCVFSNTVKNEDLTKNNADCLGYVKFMPNASTEYKYFNVATGDVYKYATVLHLY